MTEIWARETVWVIFVDTMDKQIQLKGSRCSANSFTISSDFRVASAEGERIERKPFRNECFDLENLEYTNSEISSSCDDTTQKFVVDTAERGSSQEVRPSASNHPGRLGTAEQSIQEVLGAHSARVPACARAAEEGGARHPVSNTEPEAARPCPKSEAVVSGHESSYVLLVFCYERALLMSEHALFGFYLMQT